MYKCIHNNNIMTTVCREIFFYIWVLKNVYTEVLKQHIFSILPRLASEYSWALFKKKKINKTGVLEVFF